jgi:hypothetical protein
VYCVKISIEIINCCKKYKLTDFFPSLHELVSFYREHPISTTECVSIKLGTGVHRDTISLGHSWFMPNIKANDAKSMLDEAKFNGCFLIRPATDISFNEDDQKHCYTLSFYYQGNILSIRIFVGIDNYKIGYFADSIEFPSLAYLVQYYKTVPLYRSQKLTKAAVEVPKDKISASLPDTSTDILDSENNVSHWLRCFVEHLGL